MENFLHLAEEQLKFNKDKSSVLAELGDHVETKTEFFESIGYDKEASAEKANEAMGDGEVIGQRLDQIHNRKRKAAKYLLFASAIVNIALNLIILLADKSNYSIPFMVALFILLCNLAFSYATIRFKSLWLSAALLIFSCAGIWLSTPYLAYPLCNFIISDYSSDPTKIYSFSSIMISICFSALVFLPNVFNIHHCRQMKRLKNTKRQNRIAAVVRNACLIVGVLIFILSFPYYAMNNSLCEEQAQIRDELMDFAFETAKEYNFKSKEKLEKFLESSKYDFECIPLYGYDVSENDIITYIYIFYNGNWSIKFYFDNPEYKVSCNYGISVSNNIFNASQRYLITSSGQKEKLSNTISNPRPIMYGIDESVPHSAIGMTADEIRNIMSKVSLIGIGIGIYDNQTIYSYDYQGLDTSNSLFINIYGFTCNDSDTCTYYDLTYDYHTL